MGPLLIRGGYSVSFRFSKVTLIFLRSRKNKYFFEGVVFVDYMFKRSVSNYIPD